MDRVALLPLVLAGVLAACAAEPATSDPPAASPPAWKGAPESIEIGEGLELEVPFTVEAHDVAAVKVEVAAPDGVEARIEAGKLIVHVGYNVDNPGPVRISLDDGHRVTVEVPVHVKRLAWLKRFEWTNGPAPREHGVFFLDGASGAAYLFQGSGYRPQWVPIADSWKLDVATGAWSPWSPSGDVPPLPGAARRAAQVQGSSIAYLYGGYTGWKEEEKGEPNLYRVDSKTGSFSKLVQGAGPESRQLHVLAHDSTDDRLVLFGGFGAASNTGSVGDTWLAKVDGDHATWTEVKSAKKPSPRYGSFYGMDNALRRLVVWSGAQQPVSQKDLVNAAQDAWALDLAADPPQWSRLAPQGTAPAGRRNGCSMYDPIGHRLFVFGGTKDGAKSELGLFVLDATPGREAWTKLALAHEPPSRSSGFGFVDAGGRGYCGFGNDDANYTDVNVLGYAK